MCVVQGLQLTGFRTCSIINLYIQMLPSLLNHEVPTGNIQTFGSHLTENTVFITKAIQLILFSEVIVLYSENFIKHIAVLS